MRGNIDVLMDTRPPTPRRRRGTRSPASSRRSSCAGSACARRRAAYFADVVIGVTFDAAVGQGHAAADAVERAVQSALPEADVVVHVEPTATTPPCASARTRLRSAFRACARCTT